jgi:PLP dependent protein
MGLMTIGSLDASLSTDETNTDFLNLIKCKEEIMLKFGIEKEKIELSMGMSNDFEKAVIFYTFTA